MYLPEVEVKKHLDEHEYDYIVDDEDDNPNNDAEDCLGVELSEYILFHESPEECDLNEVITLTEISLLEDKVEDCVTCGLQIPSEPSNEYCALNFSNTKDSDGDGLADRTECYLNTRVDNVDSDNDTCWDGDEVNLFYTNPLEQRDCVLSELAYESVVITDPKEGWIVKTLDIGGIAPATTLDVGITAFPAAHKTLEPVILSFEELMSKLERVVDTSDEPNIKEQVEAIETTSDELKINIQRFYKFVEHYESKDYQKEINVLKNAEEYIEKGAEAMIKNFIEGEQLMNQLKNIRTGGTFLGMVTELSQVAVGDEIVGGFNLKPQVPLEDGAYDLVAVARLKNKTLTSEPVRVQLDKSAEVNTPIPQAIDGMELNSDDIKQGWELNNEDILSEIRVITKNGKPVITGQSVYGAQVFATFQSVALASSIIVDSAEGGFEIQAPRSLEKNENHTVNLYAVVEGEDGKIRSNTVSVDFKVNGNNIVLWVLGALAFLGLAGGIAARRMKKIDELPPEHRAKENELYHAFGEKEGTPKPPEGHSQKQAEVSAAFSDQADK